jgi:hypothetical protein
VPICATYCRPPRARPIDRVADNLLLLLLLLLSLVQAAAKRKGKKNERKKMSRKRKVQKFKGMNGRDEKRGKTQGKTQQHSGGEGNSAHF